MTILVTGGAGYIGSHFVRFLEKKNSDFVVIDNFSTGNKNFVKGKNYFEADLKDFKFIKRILKDEKISGIVHFAGSSIVAESQQKKQEYYENNVIASKNIIKLAIEKNIRKFIFSSSAAVYGIPKEIPIKESHPAEPINNYGKNKLEIENSLKNASMEFPLDVVCLRYFNAAGADKKGDIGEKRNPETHLIPNVINAALSNKTLELYGDSFNTDDGTCIRDFIHVNDLANAHSLALDYLTSNKGFHIFNLGSEKGFSVLEIVKECERLLKQKIEYKVCPARDGDPDILIADSTKSKNKLKWQIENSSLEAIISSAIKFHKYAK